LPHGFLQLASGIWFELGRKVFDSGLEPDLQERQAGVLPGDNDVLAVRIPDSIEFVLPGGVELATEFSSGRKLGKGLN